MSSLQMETEYFGRDATVDVGGLVASTLEIEIEDFINEDFTFESSISGNQIVNEGRISAASGGYVALLGEEVRNSGIVVAEKGTAVLASGERIELRFSEGNNLEGVRVDPSKWKAVVENNHVIDAEEGIVILSADAKSSLRGGIVNNSGRINAQGILREGGRIMLTAKKNGEVYNSGLIDASSKTGKGGVVTMEGRELLLILILLQMYQEKMGEVWCLQEGIGKVEKIQICQKSFHLLNWRRRSRLS